MWHANNSGERRRRNRLRPTVLSLEPREMLSGSILDATNVVMFTPRVRIIDVGIIHGSDRRDSAEGGADRPKVAAQVEAVAVEKVDLPGPDAGPEDPTRAFGRPAPGPVVLARSVEGPDAPASDPVGSPADSADPSDLASYADRIIRARREHSEVGTSAPIG